MSTTTLGITVMMEQTEKKKKLMLNETLTQLSWVETHLHEKTNAHRTAGKDGLGDSSVAGFYERVTSVIA